MIAEHILIGGEMDGRRVKINDNPEYVAYPIPPVDVQTTPPRSVSVEFTIRKAIYTRRRIQPNDLFQPVICFAAVELTDREVIELLVARYPGK